MFEKCIPCARMGESCVPNLMLLSFLDLLQWCTKRQKYLGWTNQVLADKSSVPVGTINRIKAGDYADCKYSTIRNILIALIGGTSDEFSCTEQVQKELKQLDTLEQQTAQLTAALKENEELKAEIVACGEESQRKVDFLLTTINDQREEVKYLRAENTRKSNFIEKLMADKVGK